MMHWGAAKTLETMAAHVKALELENEALQREANHDELTSLLTRRASERELANQVALAKRSGEPFALLLIDLDHFKRVNDERGHAAGDDVLRGFARTLSELLRVTDHACRWGGEEFLVIAPGTNESQALLLAERIRRETESSALGVTVSIGAAGLNLSPPASLNPASLVSCADLALYSAKDSGRNQVSSMFLSRVEA
jgi:diguanylate cyclase (GGDEF)-like protein